MNRRLRSAFALAPAVFLLALAAPLPPTGARQQPAPAPPAPQQQRPAPPPAEIERIVRAFTAKETEFRQALSEYRFKRDVLLQTLGVGGQITGEFRLVSNFVFDSQGGRSERVTYAPAPTLKELQVTREDLEDLGGVQPFALELAKIDQYNFTYAGRERLDEIDTYAFDVAPKVIPKKVSERFFLGRVWIDERDLQIVKVRGKGVPEGDQRFPVFETYREQIDGKYWFPTYTAVDDKLEFKSGHTIHIRMVIKYTEYKRFQGRSVVVEEGEPDDVPEAKPTPPPALRD